MSVRENTSSALGFIRSVLEIIGTVKMPQKLKKPLKNQDYILFVQLFSISLLSTYGECGGNFGSCQHDFDVCNDDKKEC